MGMFDESVRAFLKPVASYLDDSSVTEILINGPSEVWVERRGKLSRADAKFTQEGLSAAARNLAQYTGRVLSEERAQLDARLPDGSRVHILLPPVARFGPTITIRKFERDKLTLDALLQYGSLSSPMIEFLKAAIDLRLNILVAGGTSSGKTTFLNILSTLVPDSERILTLEDSNELQIRKPHVVTMEGRPPDKNGKGAVTLQDLVHASLRMRPDRIILGEVRGAEAFHLVQAMNTGHSGCMATCHANTPVDALRRIESLCLMGAQDLPLVALRAMVASAIQMVVCVSRLSDGTRKVTHIAQVLPLDDSREYQMSDLFVFTALKRTKEGKVIGYHSPTGALPTFLSTLRAHGHENMGSSFFDPKTYKVPSPPLAPLGGSVKVQWVPSLQQRAASGKEVEGYDAELRAFESKLVGAAQAEAGLDDEHELSDVTPVPVRMPKREELEPLPKETAPQPRTAHNLALETFTDENKTQIEPQEVPSVELSHSMVVEAKAYWKHLGRKEAPIEDVDTASAKKAVIPRTPKK